MLRVIVETLASFWRGVPRTHPPTGTTRLGEALFLALRRENHRILRRLREGQPLPALSF